jgi:hypothetical protein
MDGSTWRALIAAMLVGAPALGQADGPPAEAAPDNANELPNAAPEFKDAAELLTALEAADRDLEALSASIRYVRTFSLAGDTHTRDGKLAFKSSPGDEGAPPVRRFGIEFNSLIMGQIKEDILERYIFDGEWLLELDMANKEFMRRQVVPPGERFDPLRIGEGPFPIPIGQRRDDILRRFDAELVAPGDGIHSDEPGLLALTRGMTQLKLTPRPEWEDELDFAEIRLWYKRNDEGRLLPRMARTLNHADDESTVILSRIQVNADADIPEDMLVARPPRDGWNGQVLPWRGKGG